MPPPWMRAMTSKRPSSCGVHEGLVHDLLVQLVREVGVQRAAVDGPLAGAGDDADAGHGLLATAGGRSGGDGRRARRGVGGRGALGAVGDALLVGLEGLLDLGRCLGGLSHGCSSLVLVDRRLLGDLGDLERRGLLGRVRVVRARSRPSASSASGDRAGSWGACPTRPSRWPCGRPSRGARRSGWPMRPPG